MVLDSLWEEVQNEIAFFAEDAIELSDWLAKHPEVSGEEFQACRRHASFLGKAGYDVETPFLDVPASFYAKKGNGGESKVCLLFEYDALPGVGHGCGHNVSGAMSALAAAGLSRVMERVPGELTLLGTPAEECSGSKVFFAEQGVFDGIDLAMMIHCSDRNSYAGYRSLAMDALEFRFRGRPAHASSEPWSGRNALNGVQLLFHSLDMLRQHVIPEVRIHGVISEGGLAPNIVPEHAAARFYFRAPKRHILNGVVERARKCAAGAAMASETEVEWRNFEFSFDDMLQNRSAEELVEGVFRELGVAVAPCPGASGSTDVGNVSHRCPAVQPKLSIVDEAIPLHTHEFAEATARPGAHRAIVRGAKALAKTALVVLLDDDVRRRIGEDFKKELESMPQ